MTNTNLDHPEVIFDSPDINFYDVNDKYLAVGLNDESQVVNRILIKNLQTKQVKILQSPKANYFGLSLANGTPELIFSIKSSAQDKNLIQKYNLNTEEIKDFVSLPTPYNISNLQYSPKDNYITYKDIGGNTFLQTNAENSTPLLISKYIDISNLDFQEQRFVTSQENSENKASLNLQYFIYNVIDSSKIPILNSDKLYILNPSLFNTQNTVIFSARDLSDNRSQVFYSLYTQNLTQNLDKPEEPKQILSEYGERFKLPKVSPDDKFIVTEESIAQNNAPGDPNLIIYNNQNGTKIDKQVYGTDAIWIS